MKNFGEDIGGVGGTDIGNVSNTGKNLGENIGMVMAFILVTFQIVKGFLRKHQDIHSPQSAELTLTNSEYQLLEASKAGDLELVKKIVNLHPHIVNCRDLDGEISST